MDWEIALRKLAPPAFRQDPSNLARISECEDFLSKSGILDSISKNAARFASITNTVHPKLKAGLHKISLIHDLDIEI